MKISYEDVIRSEHIFKRLMSEALSPKLAIRIVKNEASFNQHGSIVRKAYQRANGYEKVVRARSRKAQELGGDMRADGSLFVPAKKSEEFQKELDKIRAEYLDIVETQEAYDKEFNEMLGDSVDVDIYSIKLDEFEVPNITGEDLKVLMRVGVIVE